MAMSTVENVEYVEHTAYLNKKTFGALDGLRAVSILAVLWHHTWEAPTFWKATERGFLGVDLFFVISGFLIVTLILRERARSGAISLKNFYIRRFLRISPLYYGLLLALTVLLLTVGRQASMRDPFFADLPWALTYTSNWVGLTTFLTITWSLSAEEQFYLVWPPVERSLGRGVIPVLVVLLVVSQVIHFRLADGMLTSLGFAPHEPEMLRQTGFTPIMLGVLLAHGLHDPVWFTRLRGLLQPRWMPVVAMAIIMAICSIPGDDLTGWPRLSVHVAMTLLLGSAVVREDHLLMPLLKATPLVRIGVLSYGMYLLHMLCRHGSRVLLDKLGCPAEWPLFPVTLVVTVAVAWCSFTFYEKRFLKLKDRFSS
jgi:peptidoglycan/LPS O-acetylase OafA/YrhL